MTSQVMAQYGSSGDDYAFILLAWVVLGPIVGYAIGKPKGQGGSGVVLGLLLGFIGWIVVALLAPAPGYSTTGPTGPMRTCPYCAEDIKAAATVCRFCGRDVEPSSDVFTGGLPHGWSISEKDYLFLQDRYPARVASLREASARAGFPSITFAGLRSAITDMETQRVNADEALRRWAKGFRRR